MLRHYSFLNLSQSLKYYIAILVLIGLLVYAAVLTIHSALVDQTYTPLSIAYILQHPGDILAAIKKEAPVVEAVSPDHLENAKQVEKHCIPAGCFILLQSDKFAATEATINLNELMLTLTEPLRIAGESNDSFALLLPAQRSSDPKDLTPEIGTVIWDETRQLIIYQALSTNNDSFNRLFIRDYTKSWSFGLLHWVDMQLPDTHLVVTGYDQANGYLLFEHVNDATNTVERESVFSVTDPKLYSW